MDDKVGEKLRAAVMYLAILEKPHCSTPPPTRAKVKKTIKITLLVEM